MIIRALIVGLGVAIFASAAIFADEMPHPRPEQPAYEQLYSGLGDVHHPVTTTSPLAQKYFDQGLAFDYGFNHDEAYQSFSAAAHIDQRMAMASWGIALVLGPNYNLPGNDERMKIAYGAIRRAQSLEDSATPEEKALIEALAKRYGPDGKQTPAREKLYADAMRGVAAKYPDDPDAQALFAESLMDLHPWALWTGDGKPGPETLEVVATLERTLQKYPNHVGANHYYIHAVEASNDPQRALPSARKLATLAPMQGHLLHMPSHIYIRTGRYHEAAEANEAAIRVDRYFLEKSHETGVYPVMYLTHNIQFLCYSEMMEGRKRDALNSARDIRRTVPLEAVRAMPMVEVFWPFTYFAMARFGDWDDILAAPAPPADFAFTNAMWHYARGLAFAARRKFDDAIAERKALDASATAVSTDMMAGPNNHARDLTRIASVVLTGAIASAQRDHNEAIRDFTEAVRAQDALGYDEPPSWYYPVRESLGAELFADDKISAAEAVYSDDLNRNPGNPRSLFGLAECLRSEGKAAEATQVEGEFRKQWEYADVALVPVKIVNQ